MRLPGIIFGLTGLVATTVSFRTQPHKAVQTTDPSSIFAAHCVSCHGGATPAAGLDLSKSPTVLADLYVFSKGDPDHSLLIKRITGQITPNMPPSGPTLSDADIQTIKDWTKSLKSDPTPVLATRCVSCHSGANPAAGLDLSQSLTVIANSSSVVRGDPANSVLVKRLLGQGGSLMPKGGSALPDAEIATIKSWVASLADPRPIFNAKCMPCHTPSHHRGDLNLAESLKDLANSKEVTKGEADSSLLMKRITGAVGPQMPPNGPGLSDEEKNVVKAWINRL